MIQAIRLTQPNFRQNIQQMQIKKENNKEISFTANRNIAMINTCWSFIMGLGGVRFMGEHFPNYSTISGHNLVTGLTVFFFSIFANSLLAWSTGRGVIDRLQGKR